ncbi:hypothetical protein PLICRDRAFT_28930 [Plicaturopsis crispa FD-325 SS-3]|nr:hypothetical protein PLICRDRAFT_28930 [Plicaturopsis crispa FD-325 SS-3]
MNFDEVQSNLYVLGYRVQGALARYNRPPEQADPLDATIRTLGQIAVDAVDVMRQNPMAPQLHNVLHWPRHLLSVFADATAQGFPPQGLPSVHPRNVSRDDPRIQTMPYYRAGRETPPPGNDGQPTRRQPSRGQKPKAPTTGKSNPPPPTPKPTSRRRSKTPTSREFIENSDEEQPPLVKKTPKITPRKPILDDGDAHTSQDNTGNEEPRGRTTDRKGKGKASPPADSDAVATPAQPTAVKRRRSASAASTRSVRSRAMSRESTAAPDVEDDSDESDTSDMIVRPRCGWCKSKGIACVEHQGGKACEACYVRKAKCDTPFPSKSKKRAGKKPKKSALKSNIPTTTPAPAGSQTNIKIRLSRPRSVSRGPTPGPSGHHHEESPPPTTTPQPQNHAPPQKTKVGPPRGVKRPRVADGNVRPRSNMEVVATPTTPRAANTSPSTNLEATEDRPPLNPLPQGTQESDQDMEDVSRLANDDAEDRPDNNPGDNAKRPTSSRQQTPKVEPRPQFVPGSPIYIERERSVTSPSPPTAAPHVKEAPTAPLLASAASSSSNAAGSSSDSAAAVALLNAATACLRNAPPASHPAQPSPPAMTTPSAPPPVESVPPQQTSPESNSADLSHHLKTIIEAQVHQVVGPYMTAASTTWSTASIVQQEGLAALQEAQRLVRHAEATEERIRNMVEQALQEMRAIAERLQSGDVDPTLLERTLPHLLRQVQIAAGTSSPPAPSSPTSRPRDHSLPGHPIQTSFHGRPTPSSPHPSPTHTVITREASERVAQDLDEALAAAEQSRSMLPPNVTDAPPPMDMDAPPPVDMIFQSSHPANIPSSLAAPTDQPATEVTGGEESMDIESSGTEAN